MFFRGGGGVGETFSPPFDSYSRKLNFIFFFVDGLVDEMTIRLDELEELVKKGPPGNEGRGPRIGVEEGVVVRSGGGGGDHELIMGPYS